MKKLSITKDWRALFSLIKQKKNRLVFLLFFIAAAGLLVFNYALAADGSVTNTVLPTSATAGSTGNTFNFTYTASETMDSGGITITVPAGFSAPQGVAGVAGYTTQYQQPARLAMFWTLRIF